MKDSNKGKMAGKGNGETVISHFTTNEQTSEVPSGNYWKQRKLLVTEFVVFFNPPIIVVKFTE